MINPVKYTIYLEDGDHKITITPVNKTAPGGKLQPTGVYKLSEGNVDMGDIVFDDLMHQWEYTATGNLTHLQAEELASFIRNYKDSERAG
jgi:hypothetical protein